MTVVFRVGHFKKTFSLTCDKRPFYLYVFDIKCIGLHWIQGKTERASILLKFKKTIESFIRLDHSLLRSNFARELYTSPDSHKISFKLWRV